MKKVLLCLIVVLLLFGFYEFYKGGIPKISENQIAQIYIHDFKLNKFVLYNKPGFKKTFVELYKKSRHSCEPFETTPDNIIKVKLKNGDEIKVMDGDGNSARIVDSHGKEIIVKGPVGPFIEKLELP